MPTVTSKIEVLVAFDAYCAECGDGICSNVDGGDERVDITPCKKCLGTARDEGLEEGRSSVSNLEEEIARLNEEVEGLYAKINTLENNEA